MVTLLQSKSHHGYYYCKIAGPASAILRHAALRGLSVTPDDQLNRTYVCTTKVYDDHLDDDYERCKDVHRCNRAWAHYDTNSRSVNYTTQVRSSSHTYVRSM